MRRDAVTDCQSFVNFVSSLKRCQSSIRRRFLVLWSYLYRRGARHAFLTPRVLFAGKT